MSLKHLLWILVVLFFVCCKTDPVERSPNTLIVKNPVELEGFNPVIADDGPNNLYAKLFMTLVNFDPVTTKLVPLLIDSLPRKISIDTGRYKGEVAYQFKIRDEAKWTDGQPILIEDYVFSFKVALNKKIMKNMWLKPLSFIKDIVVLDDKTCQVILVKDRANAVVYFGGFELLPAHHYDPDSLLKDFPVKSFVGDNFDKLAAEHDEITQFAEVFTQEKYLRNPDYIMGAGPYKLDKWDYNDKIVFVKKSNYWGANLAKAYVLLAAGPDTLIYNLVSDDISTISYLKNKQLDLVCNLPADQFVKLENDPTVNPYFDFYTPSTKDYYVIGLNNRLSKLSKPVRKAFAQCFDVNELIKVATEGLGKRVKSPINEASPYFDTSLQPVLKNHLKAKALLNEDGWLDKDGDGILEKIINGKKVDLTLDFLCASSISISAAISPIIKKEAAKLGIKVNVINEAWGSIVQKLKNRQFDMALFRLSSPPIEYQPYSSWHSDNTGKNGRNHIGYSSPKMDSIITILQSAQTEKERKIIYAQFQQLILKDQPIVFLFYPVKTIIVNNHWQPVISTVRPGYFENAFQLKKK